MKEVDMFSGILRIVILMQPGGLGSAVAALLGLWAATEAWRCGTGASFEDISPTHDLSQLWPCMNVLVSERL